MAYLISFNPAATLGFNDKVNFKDEDSEGRLVGKPATEKELFDSFWIGFKGGDNPKFGKENQSSDRLERAFMAKSIEGGAIKLAFCPNCNQRIARHDETRTIADDKIVDFVIDNRDFEYLKSCFQKWERALPELKKYFLIIDQRLEEAKEKSAEDWNKFIADRDIEKSA